MSGSRVWKRVFDLGRRVVVESVEQVADGDEVVARVRPRAGMWLRCGRCGQAGTRYDQGGGPRRWRHLDVGGSRAFVEADAPRVKCPEHGPTVVQVPWAAHHSGFTYAFEDEVAWTAIHASKTTVSDLFRIDWKSVGSIVERYQQRIDEVVDRFAGLRRIGIDEVSYKKQRHYLTVVVDHDTGRLVWAGQGASEQTLAEFFTLLGAQRAAQITHVSADQARWIAKAVRTWCPNAVIAADPFHIVAWAIDALDLVRRRVWNTVRTPTGGKSGRPAVGEGKTIKQLRWALWKNPEGLKENQSAALEWVRKAHPMLWRAYLYKERLRLIFTLDPTTAEQEIRRWIKAAKLSRIPEFRELAFRIQKHRDSILTAIRYRLSNGLIESTNTKIRLFTRMAYGFRNPAALIALALLALGGHPPTLPWHNASPP